MVKRLAILGLLFVAVALAAISFGQGPVLRPYDGLQFQSEDARFNFFRPVSPTGQANVPYLGDIDCAGLSLDQLQERVNSLLAHAGIAATVQIRRALNPDAPVSISGVCRHAGDIPWHAGFKLSELLRLGEPTGSADLSGVLLTDGLCRTKAIDAQASNFASTGDFELRPGDRIYIPIAKVSNVIFILGGVKKPGSYAFHDGVTLANAVELAGGVSGHGDASKISVERAGKQVDISGPLKRGDVIRVGLAEIRSFVSVQGAVVLPGVVEFHPGMTLSKVLEAAGGVTSKADLRRVRLKVIGGPEKVIDLQAIRSGKLPDPELVSSCIVDVALVGSKDGSE